MSRKSNGFLTLYAGKNIFFYVWIMLEAILNACFVYLSARLLSDMTDAALEYGLGYALYGNLRGLFLLSAAGTVSYTLKYEKSILFERRNLKMMELMFENILSQSEDKLCRKDPGDYFQAIHADLKLAASFYRRLDAGLGQIARSCGAIFYVFRENGLIGAALMGLGILILLYQGCIGPRLQAYQREIQADDSHVRKITVQLYKSYEYGHFYDFGILRERYRDAYDNYLSVCSRKALWQSVCAGFSYVIGFAQTYLPLLLFAVSLKKFTLGNVLACMNNTVAFMAAFKALEGILAGLREAMAGMERIAPFLEEQKEKQKTVHGFPDGKMRIEAKKLIYRYEKRDDLKIESVVLERERHIGITGQKGSGKSTFVKILAGILQDYEGSLQVNGVEWSRLPAGQKSAYMSYLPQDFPVFDMTILENLQLAAPKKSAVELMHDTAMVNMEQEIKKMPQGIHTPINAASISTGQRQRLSVCMALLRDTQMILMDEPISNLDRTNKKVLHELIRHKREKQFLIISHDGAIFDETFQMYEMISGD